MEDKKKLKAQLTNDIAKMFRNKVERLEQQVKNQSKIIDELRNDKDSLLEKYETMRIENEQLKEWVERMQSFIDMSDEERNNYFNTLKENKKTMEKFNSIFGFYGYITKHLF